MQNASGQPTAASKVPFNALADAEQFRDPYGVWQHVPSGLQLPGYRTEIIAARRVISASASALSVSGLSLAPHGNHGDNKSWSAN